MLLTSNPQGIVTDIYTVDTDPQLTLGAVAYDETGDRYRYVKAGAGALSAGHLVQAPAVLTTAAVTVDVNTAAIGDTSVTVTAGAQAIAANFYAGGTLMVVSGTAIGTSYPISANTAITSAGGAVTVTLAKPINVAFGASDKVTLIPNQCNGVIETATSTAQPIGFAVTNIAATKCGWVKTYGPTPALADENLTLGALLTSGTSTAGAVEEYDDDTTPDTDNIVGFAIVAATDGQTQAIFATIA